jgi:hypothetical protein
MKSNPGLSQVVPEHLPPTGNRIWGGWPAFFHGLRFLPSYPSPLRGPALPLAHRPDPRTLTCNEEARLVIFG